VSSPIKRAETAQARKIFPISKVDPKDTKIEVNCRSIKPILVYFEEKYGSGKLEDFIYSTKMDIGYLEDRNNWVSYEYFCGLLDALVRYTGDPMSPFVAGTYGTKRECFGGVANLFMQLGSPGTAYKMIVDLTHTVSKVGRLKMVELNRNNCTITLLDHHRQVRNNCLIFQGLLSAVPTLWNLPPATVKEVQCSIKGGDSCIYYITWQNKRLHMWGAIGIAAGLAADFLLYVYGMPFASVFALAALPLIGYLAGRIIDYKRTVAELAGTNEKDSNDLLGSIKTIEKLNADLQAKVEQRTNELRNALDELQRSHERLVRSEKMASVGRLAAGMAHELNNPVGALRSYIQDIMEDTTLEDPRWERLSRAEKATGRCKRLVNDLLTFARESKDSRSVDINSIVEKAFLTARDEIAGDRVKFSKEFEAGLPFIKVDPLQIQQVIMNMIMNAYDAIKDKGAIVIKTHRLDNAIAISISDTGCGIPKEIQDKVFDPFFTTKAPGKGTGLGLAISYDIIKRFNGDIQLKSEKDVGSTFLITLPI